VVCLLLPLNDLFRPRPPEIGLLETWLNYRSRADAGGPDRAPAPIAVPLPRPPTSSARTPGAEKGRQERLGWGRGRRRYPPANPRPAPPGGAATRRGGRVWSSRSGRRQRRAGGSAGLRGAAARLSLDHTTRGVSSSRRRKAWARFRRRRRRRSGRRVWSELSGGGWPGERTSCARRARTLWRRRSKWHRRFNGESKRWCNGGLDDQRDVTKTR